MNKFKLQIVGALSIIIILIVTVLVVISYNSFRGESVYLNKALLREKNATIETGLVEKFRAYRAMLSSIDVSISEIGINGLSLNAKTQLKKLSRAQNAFSDGVYIFTNKGDIYNDNGEKLNINVKALNRTYYDAIFNKSRSFFCISTF